MKSASNLSNNITPARARHIIAARIASRRENHYSSIELRLFNSSNGHSTNSCCLRNLERNGKQLIITSYIPYYPPKALIIPSYFGVLVMVCVACYIYNIPPLINLTTISQAMDNEALF
ncbi:hypothetical protein LOAG_08861 [Loa loa]|uniref:Uncharacterized protein n=1 Tax=Loa loa TaxID=7209 RepID=A0A1S0TSZ5_LOALO|nr:hypothetical protein LOAG_08861 [Loa loa]EFO19632.1 hypothetical protein LOAG_08861 [Loa loa]